MTTTANRIHQAFGVGVLALLVVCVFVLAQSAADSSGSLAAEALYPRSSVQADVTSPTPGPDAMASLSARRDAASQSL